MKQQTDTPSRKQKQSILTKLPQVYYKSQDRHSESGVWSLNSFKETCQQAASGNPACNACSVTCMAWATREMTGRFHLALLILMRILSRTVSVSSKEHELKRPVNSMFVRERSSAWPSKMHQCAENEGWRRFLCSEGNEITRAEGAS